MVALFFLRTEIFAQHPAMYSQYMFNTLAINPAYTGSRDALSVALLYRSQWTGFRGAPQTQTFSLHTPLKNKQNSLGLLVVNDRLGVTHNTAVFGNYAYRIDLGNDNRLAFGLQGGISLYQDKWSQLAVDDPGDVVFANDSPVYLIPKAGFGVYYDTRKFFAGVSVPQLFQVESPQLKAYNQNTVRYQHIFFSTGYLISLNPDVKLRPTVMVKYLRNSPLQLDINTNLILKDLVWIGLSYRTGDALVGLIEYQINPQFRIGYSYDQTLTELRKFNQGSHEFFIRYEFNYGLKVLSPRYF